MPRLYPATALALIAAFLGGIGLTILLGNTNRGADRFADCRETRVAGGSGSIGGPFELISETGETVTDADIITGPTLIYFGYTFCPDVCPLDVARNAVATEILEERGTMLTPVFISIDPERDGVDEVASFTDAMHPRMIGLTGSLEQVDAASDAYRTYFNRHNGEDPDYLVVDHSTFSYLVFPGHGFVEFFRREVAPEDMADRISCFIDAAA